jgi:uncharacterized membrane protein YqjE
MEEPLPQRDAEAGLLESLRGLIRTFLSAAQTRIGILAADLERERIRVTALLLWGAIFLFVLFVGIVLLAILLVVVFWDTQRVLVLSLLTGFFLGSALAIGLGLRVWSRGAARPFQATLAELSKDQEQID